METIPNTLENDGIKKITFRPIAEGSYFDYPFAQYEKTTIYNNEVTKTEYVRYMTSEKKLGMLGFYYAGNNAGTMEYVFDGKIRVPQATQKTQEFFF